MNNEKSKDTCKEFNSLKYRTMITNGVNIDSVISNEKTEEDVFSFLENEIQSNKKQIWIKLTKSDKYKKLKDYVNNSLKDKYHLDDEEVQNIIRYLNGLLDRKKLSKSSEINYNTDSGIIENIPNLIFNKNNRLFLIKNKEKKTINKKARNTKTTIKNKKTQIDISENIIEN